MEENDGMEKNREDDEKSSKNGDERWGNEEKEKDEIEIVERKNKEIDSGKEEDEERKGDKKRKGGENSMGERNSIFKIEGDRENIVMELGGERKKIGRKGRERIVIGRGEILKLRRCKVIKKVGEKEKNEKMEDEIGVG